MLTAKNSDYLVATSSNNKVCEVCIAAIQKYPHSSIILIRSYEQFSKPGNFLVCQNLSNALYLNLSKLKRFQRAFAAHAAHVL